MTTQTTSTARTSQKALDAIAKVSTGLFIDGEWAEAASGNRFDVVNPATEEVIATVADGGPEDAQRAIETAGRVQREWAKTSPRERSEILRRAYDLIMARQDEFALIMTTEMGKPFAEAKGEVAYAAEFFRWFSEEAVRIGGDLTTTGDGKNRILVSKEPVGPCVLVTPWNFPLAMGTRKIGPAIAAGCTMVVKPAALTPLSMLRLGDILTEAGLPDGVLNIVTTKSTGEVMEPLIRDPRLRKLTFTGSTEVGRSLVEQSAQGLLRVSMELGGNAPFLVFEDADIDKAVEGAMLAKMRNIGEACTAANRFIVHESVAEEFGTKLTAKMQALSVGRGTEDGIDVGPLVEAKQRDKVAELVDDAVGQGATVLTGGSAPEGEGYYYSPTVLSDVPLGARLAKEEIFGPVAPIFTFTEEADALRMANDTEYGLVAYAFTTDFARAVRVYEGLETGMVGLNQGIVSNPAAPFGGVKASGFGREGGAEGIEEYLETKYVGLAL